MNSFIISLLSPNIMTLATTAYNLARTESALETYMIHQYMV